MKKGNKRRHPSMIRSRIKKRYAGKLPSKVVTDPFTRRKFYYNQNGRMVEV